MTTTTDHTTDLPDLMIPAIELDDIRQEMAILKWQGITPKRSIVERRLLSTQGHALLFGDDLLPPTARVMPWAETDEDPAEPTPSQRLQEWAQGQSTQIQALIDGFLEDPDEERLPQIIRVLRRRGLVTPVDRPAFLQPTGQNPGSLIAVILKTLKEGPRTMAELQTLTRTIHTAKRPEAACRQAIRRLLSKNLIRQNLDNTYQAL